jgi:glc operon protein GlcG
MDGAPLSSITIAINKAYSAARERKPTKEIGNAARNPEKSFDIGYFGDPRFTGLGGECRFGITASSSARLP